MPGNHVLLETIQLTQTASSVVFDNIPQTGYTDLKIVISARSTRGTYAEDGLGIRLNSSTTGYTYKILGANGGGLYNLDTAYEQTWVCNIPASNATAYVFGSAEAYIPNYTSSFAKSYSVEGNAENNSSTGYMTIGAILQSSTSPITSITLLAQNGSLLAGSTFSLYGIASVGTTPAIAPKATGGNIVANDGTYWYHAFLTSGYFVPQTPLTNVDYLVVAGGGGAGRGGGGAGGLRSTVTATGGGGSLESKISLTAETAYNVIVGSGGSYGNDSVSVTNGGNSSISGTGLTTITSIGGGGGGRYTSPNAASGGSGGGGEASTSAGTAGAGTANQGYAGGAAGTTSSGSAGGGGAGGAGTNGSSSGGGAAGNGGNGVAISAFATATNTGVSNYYAGGGAGGNHFGSVTGTAGLGGGGTAGAYNQASPAADGGNGIVNTGGGGGGGSGKTGTYGSNGGNGGSGIVIIRYAMV